MAAVSYLQNIDERPLAFKSYKLPWEAILKEHAIKTQQFAQSASQIQQAYKRNLDLDPQYQQNKDYLKNYMLEADKQLGKVVKSDMTIQDNASTASSVYNNIFDVDKNPNSKYLLTDDGLSKFYKGESQKSEQARTSNGGKDWNAKNDFWMKSQYQKYMNSAKNGEDISKVDEHWQNKKGFIPYYDNKKELQEIVKLCGEENKTEDQLSGVADMTKTTITTNGISKEKMQSCLNMASGQMKQQNQIDSFYDYQGNSEGLLNDYKYLIVDRYDNALKQGEINLLALKEKKDSTPEEIKQGEAILTELRDNSKDANSQWETITKGNPTEYLNNNLERISGQVGWNKFQVNMAKNLSKTEIKREYSTHAAGMAIFKAEQDMNQINQRFNNDVVMQAKQNQFDFALAQYKGDIELAKEGMSRDPITGKIIGVAGENGIDAGSPATDLAIGPDEMPNIIKNFNEEKEKANQDVQDAYAVLSDTMSNFIKQNPKAKGMTIATMKSDLSTADMVALVDKLDRTGIKDKMVLKALEDFAAANQKNIVFKMQEESLIKSLPVIENTTKNFNISRGIGNENLKVSFTSNELRQLALGLGARGFRLEQNTFENILVTPNGDRVGLGRSLDMMNAVSAANSQISESKKSMEKGMSDWWVSREGIFNLKPLNKKQSEERQYRIEQAFGVDPKSGVILSDPKQDKDGTGYVRVSTIQKDDDKNKTQVFADAKALGEMFPGQEIKVWGTKAYLKKAKVFNALPETIDVNNLKQIDAYTTNVITKIKGLGYSDESLKFKSKSGQTYQVTVGYQGANSNPLYKLQIIVNGVAVDTHTIETEDINTILAVIQQ